MSKQGLNESRGSQPFYLFDQLRIIKMRWLHMDDLHAQIKRKREEILSVAKLHGALDLKIFGSVVRGEANGTAILIF
jgi:hypothetical protein